LSLGFKIIVFWNLAVFCRLRIISRRFTEWKNEEIDLKKRKRFFFEKLNWKFCSSCFTYSLHKLSHFDVDKVHVLCIKANTWQERRFVPYSCRFYVCRPFTLTSLPICVISLAENLYYLSALLLVNYAINTPVSLFIEL
jgi:hypothetical protein